jgi:hypothetical protein
MTNSQELQEEIARALGNFYAAERRAGVEPDLAYERTAELERRLIETIETMQLEKKQNG